MRERRSTEGRYCRRFEVPASSATSPFRNFKSISGTRIKYLLVPLCFRSSCERVPRCITNFGNGALVDANTDPDRGHSSLGDCIRSSIGARARQSTRTRLRLSAAADTSIAAGRHHAARARPVLSRLRRRLRGRAALDRTDGRAAHALPLGEALLRVLVVSISCTTGIYYSADAGTVAAAQAFFFQRKKRSGGEHAQAHYIWCGGMSCGRGRR